MTDIKAIQKKITYTCLPDAQAAAQRLPKGKFHRFAVEIKKKVRYAKGRPKADGTRQIGAINYSFTLEIEGNETTIARAQEKAGCFVLISNTLQGEPGAEDSCRL